MSCNALTVEGLREHGGGGHQPHQLGAAQPLLQGQALRRRKGGRQREQEAGELGTGRSNSGQQVE